MRTFIKIVRDRDQTILEQDIAELPDGRALVRAISQLLDRIVAAHPKTDLTGFTIKVGERG
jgi:hypothetical protein